MLKIQYASDLHLEFAENAQFIKSNSLQPVGDILILAGDTGYLGDFGLPFVFLYCHDGKGFLSHDRLLKS